VANVTGSIAALILSYQDLVGAKITRKRTLVKYLDGVNFASGSNLICGSKCGVRG
jgi:lambda family phage minor tail protein L